MNKNSLEIGFTVVACCHDNLLTMYTQLDYTIPTNWLANLAETGASIHKVSR